MYTYTNTEHTKDIKDSLKFKTAEVPIAVRIQRLECFLQDKTYKMNQLNKYKLKKNITKWNMGKTKHLFGL